MSMTIFNGTSSLRVIDKQEKKYFLRKLFVISIGGLNFRWKLAKMKFELKFVEIL